MIDVTYTPDLCIARLTLVRIDAASAPELRVALVPLAQQKSRMLLDISAVDFIDSTGLGALISVLKALGNDGEMAIAGARPAVRRLLELTRLDQVMRLYPTVANAVAAMSA
jgi:anti-sigma B factor antagonist